MHFSNKPWEPVLMATRNRLTSVGTSTMTSAGSVMMMPVNFMLAVPQPNGSITALTGVKFTQFLSENILVYAGKINTLDDIKQPLTGAAL